LLPINLISLRQAHEALMSHSPELFHAYLDTFGITMRKQQEREDYNGLRKLDNKKGVS